MSALILPLVELIVIAPPVAEVPCLAPEVEVTKEVAIFPLARRLIMPPLPELPICLDIESLITSLPTLILPLVESIVIFPPMAEFPCLAPAVELTEVAAIFPLARRLIMPPLPELPETLEEE